MSILMGQSYRAYAIDASHYSGKEVVVSCGNGIDQPAPMDTR
jgi:hypothetical protein